MVQTVSKPIREFYSEQLGAAECPASNGTRHPIAARRGFSEILIEPAAAGRLHLVPAIRALYFYDASRDPSNRWINLIADKDQALINRHVAGDTGKLLNSMVTLDDIYIGMVKPVKGWYIDMDASLVNVVASTMVGAYSQGRQFTATAITDGTNTGTETLAQDGLIVIDAVPAAWTASSLEEILGEDSPSYDQRLYWFRLSHNATLTAGVEIEQVVPLTEIGAGTITTDSQSIMVKASTEYTIPVRMDLPAWVGALEFIAQATSATTANLTWIQR